MGNIGIREILVIILIVLILFGAKRIPEVMKSFGRGIKEFKKAAKDIESQVDDEDDSSSGGSKPSSPAG
ncbi:MAG: twin-arginine translocase TatA/TatE family subunit [Candidatus Eisenbacteria bacterium]